MSAAELVRQGRRIAELLADPTITGDQRRALVAMEAEVARSAEEAAIAAQRAQRIAEANAAAEAATERVRAHPAHHTGPCPARSGGWISRAEMAHGSGAVWHVDSDQMPPSWWPTTGRVITDPLRR